MAVAKIVIAGSRDATNGASVWGMSADGTHEWSYDTRDATYKVKRLDSGNFIVVGAAADNGDGGGTRNAWVINNLGVVQYEANIGSSMTARDVAFDANYLYICGTGAYRTALDLTGEATIAAGNTHQAIGVDTSGNIYVGGGGVVWTLMVYNSSFVYQWYEDTNDSLHSIDFLSTGEVVVGTSDGEIRMYETDGSSPSAGTWAYVMHGFGPMVRAIVDDNDVIYGVRHNRPSSSEERVVALNSSGVRQWGITTPGGDIEDVVLGASGILYAVGDWQKGCSVQEIDTVDESMVGIMVNPYTPSNGPFSLAVDPTFSYSTDLAGSLEGFWSMNDDAGDTGLKDHHYYGVDSATSFASTTYHDGQTFTASDDYTIDHIKLKLYRHAVTDPGDVTCYIYATSGSLPTGAALATSAAVSCSGITTNTDGVEVTFTFAGGFAVTNGVEYGVVILSSNSSPCVYWKVDSGDSKLSGGQAVRAGNPTWYSNSSIDHWFEVYVSGGESPDYVVADSSGNNRDGTASKSTALMNTIGKINGALNFVKADSDNVDLGDISAFDLGPNQDKTYAFWTNWDGVGSLNWNVATHKYHPTIPTGISIHIYRVTDDAYVSLYYSDATSDNLMTNLGAETMVGWRFWLVRVDRSGRLHLSIDCGSWEDNVDISAYAEDDMSNDQPMMIADGGRAGYENLGGAVDCVGIWSRVLTEAEEVELWNGGAGTEGFANSAPAITDQSSSSAITIDQAVVLSVTATGVPAPTYQWSKDGSPLAGETGSTLSFTATGTSGGTYNCTATNVAGSDTTSDIVLSMVPVITDQSPDTSGLLGQSTTLFATAAGYPALSYQWYKNNVLLSGETATSINFYATYDHAGTYKCIVTNVVGSATSADIELTVLSNPYVYNMFDLNLDEDRVS